MVVRVRQNGFTLIELVCTITILGILAATAIPRFANLGSEARIAKVNAMAGALHSAAQMWHAACLMSQDPSEYPACKNSAATVTKNGVSMSFLNGYPNAGGNIGGNQIDIALVSHGDFKLVLSDRFNHAFFVNGARDIVNCWVTYCVNSLEAPYRCPNRGKSYSVVTNTIGC